MSEQSLQGVRQQYEDYPYPPRDPQAERSRLLEVLIDRLAPINFYCFGGRNTFQRARVLVAGGGTGDSTIFLAEQLLAQGGEVTYADISRASMEVAQKRAAIRKLDNITWMNAAIESLCPEQLGLFDYVSCTGVLHHLADPLHGLKSLTRLLKPGGGMGLLVYAQYGRTGVYQMQRLLRLLNKNEASLPDKVSNARRLLQALPQTNWFKHNLQFLSDHERLGDSGLVDLLLHEHDVAYSIDEAHALAAAAGLRIVEFCDVRMRMALNPEHFIADDVLRQKISSLGPIERQCIAELLVGLFTKHIFYASSAESSQAQFGDISLVPFFFPERQYQGLAVHLRRLEARGGSLALRHDSGVEISLAAEGITMAVLGAIDGKRCWREVFATARAEVGQPALADEEIVRVFRPTFEQFRQLDWILLRGQDVGVFPDTLALQEMSRAR